MSHASVVPDGVHRIDDLSHPVYHLRHLISPWTGLQKCRMPGSESLEQSRDRRLVSAVDSGFLAGVLQISVQGRVNAIYPAGRPTQLDQLLRVVDCSPHDFAGEHG